MRRITFDTNLVALWNTRVFWGTVCEEIGQRLILTPTATRETLGRVRLETQRAWGRKLNAINRDHGLNWTPGTRHRLSRTAGVAARDWLRDRLKEQGHIYETDRARGEEIEDREMQIEDTLDDAIFSDENGTGTRDRRIVIEAMARGYDLLATNNFQSINHGLLNHWIESGPGRALEIGTRILRPEPAEEALRKAHGRSIDWVGFAAGRACMTDPYDGDRAARELYALIDGWERRGMGELQDRVGNLASTERGLTAIMTYVQRHGAGQAMRAEREGQTQTARAVSRQIPGGIELM